MQDSISREDRVSFMGEFGRVFGTVVDIRDGEYVVACGYAGNIHVQPKHITKECG